MSLVRLNRFRIDDIELKLLFPLSHNPNIRVRPLQNEEEFAREFHNKIIFNTNKLVGSL